MAEQAKKCKNRRRNKQSTFTRKHKHLLGLLEEDSTAEKLQEVFTELKESYRNLERSHDDYAAVVEESVLDEEGDFLESSSVILNEMDKKVADKVHQLKTVETENNNKELFQRSLTQFKTNIESFGSPSGLLSELSTENRVSCADMRLELSKIEGSYEKLLTERLELISLDSTADFTEVFELFSTKVTNEVEKCKVTALAYMKTAAPPTVDTGGGEGGGSSTSTTHSSTKRETVMLPHFSGEEKTAYLKYPV